MKKKIFLSYSQDDIKKVRCLQRLINRTEVFTPIIIADNRQALKQLSEKVINGIKESDYFIPVLTRKSLKTQWINQEIGFATATGCKMVPIIETQCITKLKGFINKQLDLPYGFQGSNNATVESNRFRQIAKTLINDLEQNIIELEEHTEKTTAEAQVITVPINNRWVLNHWGSETARFGENQIIFLGKYTPDKRGDGAHIDLVDALEIGKVYEVSCFAKSLNSTGKIQLWCNDDTNTGSNPRVEVKTEFLPPSKDGKAITLEFPAIAKNIRIHLQYKPGNGKIQVGDIKITELLGRDVFNENYMIR